MLSFLHQPAPVVVSAVSDLGSCQKPCGWTFLVSTYQEINLNFACCLFISEAPEKRLKIYAV